LRFGVLVSGSGTNLAALLDAERAGAIAPGEIACVISNRPDVAALERARAAGKPAEVVDHKGFDSREAFEDALCARLAAHGVQAIVLAGFMRVLTPRFLGAFPDRVINIHPSLLPAFPGIDGPRQAFEYGAKWAGCTVHFVDPSVDGGAIILQDAVPVTDDDTVDTLRTRILAREHVILPRAVQLVASGQLRREGRRVLRTRTAAVP
jgi:phosphoribosylglycinamide formyltransferase-1